MIPGIVRRCIPHTRKRSRARLSHGIGTPSTSSATRTIPARGLSRGQGGRDPRVRNSRGRPHGASLRPVSRSPSGRPRLPQTQLVVTKEKEGDARTPGSLHAASKFRGVRVGCAPTPARPMGPALIVASPPSLLSLPASVQAVCAHFEGLCRALIEGKGRGG